MDEQGHKRSGRTPMLVMLMIIMATLLLTACGYRFWEPQAPQRSFTLEDLLIDQDIVPTGWKLTNPIFPAGDDLCSTECTSIGFEVPDNASSIEYGLQGVYRYGSSGQAQRTFKIVYLTPAKLQRPTYGRSYRSPVANQSHFGCFNLAGNVGVYCEWAAQYEEYVVVLGARMVPGQESFAALEQVVKAIDVRMAHYLGKP